MHPEGIALTERIYHMKTKRIFTLITALLLAIATLVSMTSCYELGDFQLGTDGDYVTRDELQSILDNLKVGDNLNIDITTTAQSTTLAASRAMLSAVSVYSYFEQTSSSSLPGLGSTQEFSHAGSGVIYKLDKAKGDAYIITNYHVVFSGSSDTEDGISDNIEVYLYGQEFVEYKIDATYVGGAMNYDIAVLKVEGSDVLRASSAMAAEFADSNEVSVLETAVAVGNAEALGISATAGYVNVDSEYITIGMTDKSGIERTVELRVLRVDAPVNQGNSGGGIFNIKGELIGIVNARSSKTDAENINYATPSNLAKALVENILYYADKADVPCVYRCMLGITVASAGSRVVYDTESGKIRIMENVTVTDLTATSFAKGELQVGDVVKSITVDGVRTEITRMFMVIDSMLYARVGSTVEMEIVRGDKTLTKTFVIGESTLTAVK